MPNLIVDRSQKEAIVGHGSGIILGVAREARDAQIFHRTALKVDMGNGSSRQVRWPIARLNGVYLYMTSDNTFLLSTDPNRRP